jgi:hypothetical protein
MADYEFVTVWRVEAPRERVWDAIYRSNDWPVWWRGVERVVEVVPGDERGVGSLRRYTWKSKLPYRLTFDMRTVRVEPLLLIEGAAEGELTGTGRWQFGGDETATVVRYDWRVRTTKPWMNAVSPVARPLFAWNHDVVMGWGAEGLARRLGARVVSVRAAGSS